MPQLNLNNYEIALSGGHPNSLGNTVAVVDEVLKNPNRLEELFNCYFSKDPVVRLRVSNAMKRIAASQYDLLLPYVDHFITKISKIDQASTQWTFAQLMLTYGKDLTDKQLKEAIDIMKKNLSSSNDWIVLNQTMKVLSSFAKKDQNLHLWLMPVLEKLTKDKHSSVSRMAKKFLEK
jgi:hypothetical protein